MVVRTPRGFKVRIMASPGTESILISVGHFRKPGAAVMLVSEQRSFRAVDGGNRRHVDCF